MLSRYQWFWRWEKDPIKKRVESVERWMNDDGWCVCEYVLNMWRAWEEKLVILNVCDFLALFRFMNVDWGVVESLCHMEKVQRNVQVNRAVILRTKPSTTDDGEQKLILNIKNRCLLLNLKLLFNFFFVSFLRKKSILDFQSKWIIVKCHVFISSIFILFSAFVCLIWLLMWIAARTEWGGTQRVSLRGLCRFFTSFLFILIPFH